MSTKKQTESARASDHPAVGSSDLVRKMRTLIWITRWLNFVGGGLLLGMGIFSAAGMLCGADTGLLALAR